MRCFTFNCCSHLPAFLSHSFPVTLPLSLDPAHTATPMLTPSQFKLSSVPPNQFNQFAMPKSTVAVSHKPFFQVGGDLRPALGPRFHLNAAISACRVAAGPPAGLLFALQNVQKSEVWPGAD